jgi:hypothetical protein
VKLLEISVGSDITNQLLITFFAFVRYWRKKWEYNEAIHQLFIDYSVKREVLHITLIKVCVPLNPVRLNKMFE